ncbi:MAG: sugar ABC transporter permease [Bacillota bacterium]
MGRILRLYGSSEKRRQQWLGLLLAAPAMAWVLGLVVYPAALTIWLSFHNQRMVEPDPPWIGLAHYRILLGSTEFWDSLLKTVLWTGLNLLFTVPAGVALAVLLNQDVPLIRPLRTWILLPWSFPIVVIALMWKWMLDPSLGIVNELLVRSGLTSGPVLFLSSRQVALVTVAAVNAWRWIPEFSVVVLAALATVPRELQEAASVDGASSWVTFWRITLPQIRPVILTVAFMFMMQVFNMFPPVWLMTAGGPGNATMILPVSVYVNAFQLFRLSRSAALSVLLLGVVVFFSALYLRLLRPRFAAE